MTAKTDPASPRIIELLRVSGQGQADRDTPADQRAALDKLREAFPGVLVERIDSGAVRAISGAADFRDRPDLRRLKELSDARAFDELRVRHLDRLTRHDDPRERFVVYGLVADAGAIIRDASGHVIDPRSEVGRSTGISSPSSLLVNGRRFASAPSPDASARRARASPSPAFRTAGRTTGSGGRGASTRRRPRSTARCSRTPSRANPSGPSLAL
jgi:hypothetical protein